MQTALDFLSTLVLKDHSKYKAKKNKHGEENNAHMNVHSRSNNDERNILTRNEIILTRNEIIDCIAEKIVSVITQVSKETKL